MSSAVLLIVILVSLLVGYFFADWQGAKKGIRRAHRMYARYLRQRQTVEDTKYYDVLTKLLNEQPDEALDQFIAALAVNTSTLEVHLALGALLRRRGEFDRAVRVHQNLLSQPKLDSNSAHQIQLELACDYWRSGLLDRAETLLKEITESQGVDRSVRWQAGAYLVEIYQELGEWLSAIDVADQLTTNKFADEPDLWRRLQAQFCCELAEMAKQNSDYDFAKQKLRQATAYDGMCVRAFLLQADIAIELGEIAQAVIALNHIVKVAPHYSVETIARFKACQNTLAFDHQLHKLQSELPSVATTAALLTRLLEKNALSEALIILKESLPKIKPLEGDIRLLSLIIDVAQGAEQKEKHLRSVLSYLEQKMRYQCEKCGVNHERLVWQCHSCRNWSSVRAC